MSLDFICKQCSRVFKDRKNYKEHCFKIHHINITKKKVYKCSLCSYYTLLKSRYISHNICHLNNKVLKCSKCDFSTITVRNMKKHEQVHKN